MSVTGHRERKKARTRETIVRAALELFHERGFEPTTVADIAAAADIAPRTFFAYFPAKEDVVFHDSDEVLARFERHLRERPPEQTVFDAMRGWIAEWSQADLSYPDEKRRRALIRATPALAAHERVVMARFEALIADAVAADLGVAADSLRPHLVSAAAVAALDALGRFYHEDDDRHPAPEEALAIVDEALVFLRGGLEALRRES